MGILDAIRRAKAPGRPPGDIPVVAVDPAGKKLLLVYLFEGLGDTVLLGPAIQALLNRGCKKVAVLTTKKGARGLKLLDLPIRIMTLPPELLLDEGDSSWKDKEVRAAADKMQSTLQKARFDIAVDLSLRGPLVSRRWVDATEADHRLGWRRKGEENPIELSQSTEDIRWQCERHWTKVQLAPLAPLGAVEADYNLEFSLKDSHHEKAATFWDSKPRVLLIPGSRSQDKRFAPEHFQAIARHVQQLGGSVVVAGAPDERKLLKQVAEDGKVYCQKSLEVLAALVHSADAVVTNDTGPMHLAFLMRRPTVAVFTQMSALVWGPFELHPRTRVLQAPDGGPSDASEVWSRAIQHALDAVLAHS